MVQKAEESILDQIKENLSVIAGPYKVEELTTQFEETSLSLQTLAITNILVGYNRDGFIANLLSSAYTLRYYLMRSKEENNTSHYIAISRSEGFFDAVAAGSLELAKEIARLSPDYWIEDGEYEDDFCYYHFLHTFVRDFPNRDEKKLTSIISQFESCVAASSEYRLAVCKSFLLRDSDAFNEGFNDLLIQFDNEKEKRYPQLLDIADLSARKYIFVEGLALLRIAELLGFTIDSEYQYCPSIVRVKNEIPLIEDLFKDIEEIRKSKK